MDPENPTDLMGIEWGWFNYIQNCPRLLFYMFLSSMNGPFSMAMLHKPRVVDRRFSTTMYRVNIQIVDILCDIYTCVGIN